MASNPIEAELKSILLAKQQVELWSLYKGVPVMIRADIEQVAGVQALFAVQPPESISLTWSRQVVIHSPLLLHRVQARVDSFDVVTGKARLSEIRYQKSGYFERSQARVEPRNPISVEMKSGTHSIMGTLADISLIGAGVYITMVEPEHALKRAERTDLIICLPEGRVQVSGKIRGVGKSVDFYRLAINFTDDTPQNRMVMRYISQRRKEILDELPRLYEASLSPDVSDGRLMLANQ